METLRIRWADGEGTFEPGTTVRVGRDVDAEVQLRNTNLSRRHAEVVHTASGWVLRDLGSAQGTWRDGRQVQSVEIRGTVQVTLGREGRGEVVTLEASAVAPHSPVATELPGRAATTGPTQIVGGPVSHGVPESGGGGDGTVIVGAATSNRPGGALRAEAIAGATVVTGDVLNVECAGRSYSFQPGHDVSIGRDATCDIVSSNPTVSRRHARITHDGSGWTLRDEGSSSGTLVDGARITDYRLKGSVAVWLGDESTGERLVMVASGTNPVKPRKKQTVGMVPIVIVVGLIVVALAGWLVARSGGDDGPSNDQLARATVRLVAGDLEGSGTIIDAKEGLILTNAHVAEPDAPGIAVRYQKFARELHSSTREIAVLVAPALDKAAEPRFIAEVVAVDGYLDLAVLKITKTTIGQLIEADSGDLDSLVDVKVGDSTHLSTGDALRVFGYPTASDSSAVTLLDGVVSGQVQDARIGSNRGMLNISAGISPGNSGGLAVNNAGELVGVPTLIRNDAIPSMRPSEFANALIDAARTGKPYVSPWFRPVTTEEVTGVQVVSANTDSGIRFDCSAAATPASPSDGAVGVSFNFKGFEVGEHQDMIVAVISGDTILGERSLAQDYPVKFPTASGCATITVPIDASGLTADSPAPTAIVGLGPGYTTVG